VQTNTVKKLLSLNKLIMKSFIIFAFIILACFNNVFAQQNITITTANFSKNLNTGFFIQMNILTQNTWVTISA